MYNVLFKIKELKLKVNCKKVDIMLKWRKDLRVSGLEIKWGSHKGFTYPIIDGGLNTIYSVNNSYKIVEN